MDRKQRAQLYAWFPLLEKETIDKLAEASKPADDLTDLISQLSSLNFYEEQRQREEQLKQENEKAGGQPLVEQPVQSPVQGINEQSYLLLDKARQELAKQEAGKKVPGPDQFPPLGRSQQSELEKLLQQRNQLDEQIAAQQKNPPQSQRADVCSNILKSPSNQLDPRASRAPPRISECRGRIFESPVGRTRKIY